MNRAYAVVCLIFIDAASAACNAFGLYLTIKDKHFTFVAVRGIIRAGLESGHLFCVKRP